MISHPFCFWFLVEISFGNKQPNGRFVVFFSSSLGWLACFHPRRQKGHVGNVFHLTVWALAICVMGCHRGFSMVNVNSSNSKMTHDKMKMPTPHHLPAQPKRSKKNTQGFFFNRQEGTNKINNWVSQLQLPLCAESRIGSRHIGPHLLGPKEFLG